MFNCKQAIFVGGGGGALVSILSKNVIFSNARTYIGKRPPFRNVKVTFQTDEIKFTNSNFIGKSEASDMKEGDRKLTTSKAITIQVKINDFIII